MDVDVNTYKVFVDVTVPILDLPLQAWFKWSEFSGHLRHGFLFEIRIQQGSKSLRELQETPNSC